MKKQSITLGITLFSMFFGAGNLIFAPWMGSQAGGNAPLALLGFIIMAVVCPIGAILIIFPFGTAKKMIDRLCPWLGTIFMTIVYLLIGPCIAIPRTASTSQEMWTWLIGDGEVSRVLYIIVFFLVAAFFGRNPGKLKDILGKILGPLLILLVALLCIPVFFLPSQVALPTEAYAGAPFLTGINEGYQTMDILAAFCFGIVIVMNIKEAKIKNERKALIRAALIAGGLLAIIYTALALVGMRTSELTKGLTNGAQILSQLAYMLYGEAGQLLCGCIFLLACCNVCAGLLACCSEYFSVLVPRVPYLVWLSLFTVLGAVTACTGLDSILSWSGTVLSIICPIALLLLITGLYKRPENTTLEID